MIGLIACSAKKLGRRAPARELYCSTLFRKSLAYAAPRCRRVFVISARHHLVDLDTALDPYDQELAALSRAERSLWGSVIAAQLALHDAPVHGLLVLAGAVYLREVVTKIAHWWPPAEMTDHVTTPLAGMQIGERLRWLSQREAA